MNTFKIALADDHRIIRDTLRMALSSSGDMEVIADAGDGLALLNILEHLPVLPDMVILDVSMPMLAGPDVARHIRELFPRIKILMFSMHAEMEYVSQAFMAGADGYLLKEESAEELFAAIDAIRNGQTYRSPRLEFLN
jgi:DNA-binding NarL/FixJ family response regulator